LPWFRHPEPIPPWLGNAKRRAARGGAQFIAKQRRR
jgi:hypothetical protein